MAAIHVWRRILGVVFNPLERFIETRRMRRSFVSPFVTGCGRDRVRFYDRGRSVDVNAELLTGAIERSIHALQPLVWRETGVALNSSDAAEVIDAVCRNFDRRKIKWALWPKPGATQNDDAV